MHELDVLHPRLSHVIKLDSHGPTARAVSISETKGIPKNSSRLKQACQQLESLFIGHLLKEMRATINESGWFGGGRARELYTSMLDSQFAKELSAKGGIGLAALLLADLESHADK
jgi:flagellar protein FlgJ